MVLGIVKSAEEQVENGQIGIVVPVDPLRMVVTVAFRPLDEVAEPTRRMNVGVLENAQEIGHQQHDSHGFRVETHDDRETNRTDRRPTNHIEGAEIKRSVRVEPLRTVVHLVENAPQKIAAVHGAVPDVHSKFIEQNARYRSSCHADARQVEQLCLWQICRPKQGKVTGQIEVEKEKGDTAQYPEFDLWQRACREQRLVNHQQGVYRYDRNRYGIEQNFKWCWHDKRIGFYFFRCAFVPQAVMLESVISITTCLILFGLA